MEADIFLSLYHGYRNNLAHFIYFLTHISLPNGGGYHCNSRHKNGD